MRPRIELPCSHGDGSSFPRQRQAESSEAERRARELMEPLPSPPQGDQQPLMMVLMEAELEKARGRGHAAALREALAELEAERGARAPGDHLRPPLPRIRARIAE